MALTIGSRVTFKFGPTAYTSFGTVTRVYMFKYRVPMARILWDGRRLEMVSAQSALAEVDN